MPKQKNKNHLPVRPGKQLPAGLAMSNPLVIRETRSSTRRLKGTQKARSKHIHDLDVAPTTPTLADRFFALPLELRNNIYSLLLVRPVKWKVRHADDCKDVAQMWDPNHEFIFDDGCVSCGIYGVALSTWRTNPWHGVDSLFLSPWAPQRGNPFLCSDCHRSNFRASKPSLKDVICRCTRRTDLSLLLVSRRFSLEASQLFYNTNVFAFGHREVLTRFLSTTSAATKAKIHKVSYLAGYPARVEVDYEGGPSGLVPCWHSNHSLPWNLLATLPNLRVLELDAFFLLSLPILLKLRQLHNLSCVSFVMRHARPKNEVWDDDDNIIGFKGEVAPTTLMQGGIAGEVAALLKREGMCKRREIVTVWKKYRPERMKIERMASRWELGDEIGIEDVGKDDMGDVE